MSADSPPAGSPAGSSPPLPPRVRRGYALGSVATGTFGTVPGLLLLPYLTDTIGITAAVAGLIVFLPKAWDVLLNPIAGRISDSSQHPGGRRRPFLAVAGPVLALCFALIFAGPTGNTTLAGIWVVVWFIAAASAYAFFQVPYVAMPAEMTLDYDERTRLMTWRVAILAFTILLSGATAPMVVNAVGGADSPAGYRAMGVYVAAILVIGSLGAWLGTRGAPEHRVETAGGSLGSQFALIAKSQNFRHLLLTFIVQALAIGTMLAGVAYVASDIIESDAATTILFAAFVAPALAFTPVWERWATGRSKRRGYLMSSVVLGAGMAGLFGGLFVAPLLAYAAAAIVGVGYAGVQMFPMAMLPDVASGDAAETGENRIGVYTGIWTAGETLGLAIGPGMFALVLTLGGYVSSTSDAKVVQPDSALTAIHLGFTLVPLVLVALSFMFLLRYRDPALARDER
jgi:GPH family glycoside/pentoside/hexuronide:cation symporter